MESLFPLDQAGQLNQILASLGPPRSPAERIADAREQEASERRVLEVLKMGAHRERQDEHVADLRCGLVHVLGARLESELNRGCRELNKASEQQYIRDAARFRKWCAETGVSWLPAAPETVAAFILETCASAGRMPATAARLCGAIKLWHLLKGEADPTANNPFLRAVRKWIKGDPQEPEPVADSPPGILTEH